MSTAHWRLKIEIVQAVLVAAAGFGSARRHLTLLLTAALAINAFSIIGEPVRHNMLTLHGCLTNDGYLPLFVYGIALWQLTQDRSVVTGFLALASLAMGGLQWLGRWVLARPSLEIAFPIYVVHYVVGCTPFVAILLASVAAVFVDKALNRFIKRPIQLSGPVAIKVCNAALTRIASHPAVTRSRQRATALPQAMRLAGG